MSRTGDGAESAIGQRELGSANGFREQIQQARERFPELWEASRKYISPDHLSETLSGLIEQIRQSSHHPHVVERLVEALRAFHERHDPRRFQQSQAFLKEVTGFPPSKAVRALVVWGWVQRRISQKQGAGWSSEERQEFLRRHSNPYDVLLEVPFPSLLDIGAGDLTFEQELAEYFRLNREDKRSALILHAFDRLQPGSKVGGVYHRDPERERYLRDLPGEAVNFRFWGNRSLSDFAREKHALSCYTIVTCHAPANPTFAYEPSRLDSRVIQEHVRSTRGVSRKSRFDGEPVLEVSHRGQMLTFPPWKFEILGPLHLLAFMCRRAEIGVLSAVDDEVFWELFSQLLDDSRYRPKNQILTPEVCPRVFGDLYDRVQRLRGGDRLELTGMVRLRATLPDGEIHGRKAGASVGIGFLEIRRGAMFPGVPSSYTARQFPNMKEESEPWWIIFVPVVH